MHTESTPQTELYMSLLKMFVSDDELRPDMQQPFVFDSFVGATNGDAMITFHRNKLHKSDYPTKAVPPVVDRLYNMENHIGGIDVSKLRNAVEMANAETSKFVHQPCPDCNDTYSVSYAFTDKSGITHKQDLICPTCTDGDPEARAYICLKEINVYLSVGYIEDVLKVAEATNQQSIFIFYDQNVVRFRLLRSCNIYLATIPDGHVDQNDIVVDVEMNSNQVLLLRKKA